MATDTTARPSTPIVVDAPPPAAPPAALAAAPESLSPADLAQLLSAVNDVTARLASTHDALNRQVASLKLELDEAHRQVERSRHLAMLGEMAAGIAHEVRNPLGSIALYARMLNDDLADRPPQQQTAQKIARAVTRVEAIVSDVLCFARQTHPRPTPTDTADLLASALEAARADTPDWRAVTIDCAPIPRELRAITCDHQLLHQALINVMRNAVEAMGEARAKVRRLSLTVSRHDARQPDGSLRPMVALAVRDTGPGIAPDDAARLFTPFFTTRATGTGLGLAIVHRIMDAHAGRVALRNADSPPSGCIVELLLPLAPDGVAPVTSAD